MRSVLLALAAALCCGAAVAQSPCPAGDEVTAQELLGAWQADLQGSWDGATLLLEPHPEYAGSFRGRLERAGQVLQVAGDLDENGFTLEESSDGKHIAATWLGDIVEGSCGKEIRGTWTKDGEEQGRSFVLRRK